MKTRTSSAPSGCWPQTMRIDHGIPHPAIVVIDADGMVSHRFSEQRYTDRPEVDDVLAALKRDAGS